MVGFFLTVFVFTLLIGGAKLSDENLTEGKRENIKVAMTLVSLIALCVIMYNL